MLHALNFDASPRRGRRPGAFALALLSSTLLPIAGCATNGTGDTPATGGSAAIAAGDPTSPAGTRLPGDSEKILLEAHVQLTFARDFTRAGEAYFDPTGRWIIFQATPQPAAGAEPSPYYTMYVAPVKRDASGHITGLGDHIELSLPGSANTCGWFHPTEQGVVLFGTTNAPPSIVKRAGYQREGRDYSWDFPLEMEICTRTVPAIVNDLVDDAAERARLLARPDVERPIPMFERDGYDAEGSWSPDGRTVLYCQVDPETGDGDLYIYVMETGEQRPIVTARGYDGGPFFSPDGTWITYRSDRVGNDLLQIFVAELSFDEEGLPNGIVSEHRLTDGAHVSWCPYWSRPEGQYLVYASSEVGHFNYEVFALPVDRPALSQAAASAGKTASGGAPAQGEQTSVQPMTTRRVTCCPGFDGLPVFSFDGQWMMWTAQRGADRDERDRPTSQIWAAKVLNRPF